MAIEIDCPSCGKQIKVRDSAAGKSGKCPHCGNRVKIPDRTGDALEFSDDFYDFGLGEAAGMERGADEIEPPTDRRPCPMCGEMIVRTAAKCRFCGEKLGDKRTGHSRDVERQVQDVLKEKHDRDTSLQLFLTGILGCFSPILAIYGIVFLLKRPYDYERKGLAIAGTILHCLWTVVLIAILANRR